MPYHFKEIASTQLFLKNLPPEKLTHLEYATADVQTAGIGRQGRSWISEKGNLFLSLYLSDFKLPLTWIPHWAGVSLINALVHLGIPARHMSLKWPNDLILNQSQKAAGILCEKIGDGIVVGIGANLISAPDLSDRETGSLQSIAPGLDFHCMNQRLAKGILHELSREPALLALRVSYQTWSRLKPGESIQWTDLQTHASGSGQFAGYGDHGELLAFDGEKHRALFSEEVKLILA